MSEEFEEKPFQPLSRDPIMILFPFQGIRPCPVCCCSLNVIVSHCCSCVPSIVQYNLKIHFKVLIRKQGSRMHCASCIRLDLICNDPKRLAGDPLCYPFCQFNSVNPKSSLCNIGSFVYMYKCNFAKQLAVTLKKKHTHTHYDLANIKICSLQREKQSSNQFYICSVSRDEAVSLFDIEFTLFYFS